MKKYIKSNTKSYTSQEVLDAVKWAYGFTTKEARDYIRRASDERKQLLVDEYKNNFRRNFYED